MSCSSKQRHLCGKEECKICFNRSFASYDGKTSSGKLKVDCWDNEKNGEIKPINIRIKTGNKYWFICDNCNIPFESMICNISSKDNWCFKCSHDKLSKKRRTNPDDYLEKAKKIHGDKYDYSKTNYINSRTNIEIICKEHGLFEQNPLGHLNSIGCPKCKHIIKGQTSRKTKEQFIEKAIKKHGDKYDYSETVYTLGTNKIKIICNEHGMFEITPANHLSGRGCQKCSSIEYGNKMRMTQDVFLEKAIKKHGDKYDYSETVYTLGTNKIKIICKEHGMFEQQATSHLAGSGCCKCFNYILTQEEFIERVTNIFNNKYDYSETIYTKSDDKIKIICKEHGIFEQRAFSHMRGSGCPKCGTIQGGMKLRLTQEEFIILSKDKHGDKYDYSLSIYTKSDDKIKIICKEHGIFEQNANSHMRGSGCQKCGSIQGGMKGRLTQKCFLEKAKKIHGDRYDYSLVNYTKGNDYIKIICKEHGIFEQRAYTHIYHLGANCPYCSNNTWGGESQRKNWNMVFINKAKKIWGEKFDYSLVEYKKTDTPIQIKCIEHNYIFEQTPHHHLRNHNGCKKCLNYGYSKKQIQWLDFISIFNNITIQHAINNKEHKIENIGKVDGYCKEKNTVYEFHGDLWHGNPMKYNIFDNDAKNPFSKKTYYELYETTIKRDKKIKELGYNLVIMWENQWNKINYSIKLLQNKWRDYKNKPHKCEKCNISFKFKSQLEKHYKTELHKTGKKKTRSDKKEEFKCEICNLYTTNQQTNLKLHILNNHKTKEERKNEFPYYCELCNSGCMEEKLYKKHLETKKHKKKLDLLSK